MGKRREGRKEQTQQRSSVWLVLVDSFSCCQWCRYHNRWYESRSCSVDRNESRVYSSLSLSLSCAQLCSVALTQQQQPADCSLAE